MKRKQSNNVCRIKTVLEQLKRPHKPSNFVGKLVYTENELDKHQYPYCEKDVAIENIKKASLDKFFEVRQDEAGNFVPDYEHICKSYTRSTGGSSSTNKSLSEDTKDTEIRIQAFSFSFFFTVQLFSLFSLFSFFTSFPLFILYLFLLLFRIQHNIFTNLFEMLIKKMTIIFLS